MNAEWITSPSARRVLQHADDARPAWLWSQDGQTLLWQNKASELFLARIKKTGLKRAPLATPIKGQVARNIRLGSVGRTSLARIQFLAGSKPASSTCATTPLALETGQTVLLVVGVDPIDPEIVAAANAKAEDFADPVPADSAAETGESLPEPALDHEASAADRQAPVEAAADDDAYQRELESWREAEAEQPGSGFAAAETISATEPDSVEDAPAPYPVQDITASQVETALDAEPLADQRPAGEVEPQTTADAAPDLVPVSEPPTLADSVSSRLSRLVDRLSAGETLYRPLTGAEEPDVEAPLEDAAGETETAPAEPEIEAAKPLFKVTARSFVAESRTPATEAEPETESQADFKPEVEGEIEAVQEAEAAAPALPPAELIAVDTAPPQAAESDPTFTEELTTAAEIATDEAVERVSRYNFDELSRILNDRIGESRNVVSPAPAEPAKTGALVNLGGETLVLNRLPLGILVFRDQQILFANRAITEMVGYDSVENLRNAGLAAVFPAAGPESEGAGPVNHLVQRDGTLVPVTARLQSISWQGRPALMLSASTTEVRTAHEAAVRAFAASFAEVRGDGYFETTRAGVISAINAKATGLIGRKNEALEGTALAALLSSDEAASLRSFLERPARFAETARPCVTLRSGNGRAEIIVFAQGQAGVVTGYFGFVHGRETEPLRLGGPPEIDPSLLARISRGVRRPLNTIIGFSDLIRTAAFGQLGNERYENYAEDITTAGHEIAALVDELDDYARLRDGRYLPQRASIELTALLESCVVRIRQQANLARVIVRNAISEHLPRITADRASLAQAVLNLLASAIDQSPAGGAVIISAKNEDDGSISIHVRDSSNTPVDMAERFVVFRDGVGKDGRMMTPVRSSVGLALTRSLLAVNTFSLDVDPAGEQGMLFTLSIPADLVEKPSPAAQS